VPRQFGVRSFACLTHRGDIQATDIGAMGSSFPLSTRSSAGRGEVGQYPPTGAGMGAGQPGALWGDDYRQTANANIVVVS
jgi:hypothetical protein